MPFELRRLTPNMGHDIYDMLQEIPEMECGFGNSVYARTYDEYQAWLVHSDEASRGIGLQSWQVPQTTYFLYADGAPVGMAKLRHWLTPALHKAGGHIGYGIRPSARGHGYGSQQLALMLDEARKLGLSRALITVNTDNPASLHVALRNGGTVEAEAEGRYYIWVELALDKG